MASNNGAARSSTHSPETARCTAGCHISAAMPFLQRAHWLESMLLPPLALNPLPQPSSLAFSPCTLPLSAFSDSAPYHVGNTAKFVSLGAGKSYQVSSGWTLAGHFSDLLANLLFAQKRKAPKRTIALSPPVCFFVSSLISSVHLVSSQLKMLPAAFSLLCQRHLPQDY